jgi:hypothetical protein
LTAKAGAGKEHAGKSGTRLRAAKGEIAAPAVKTKKARKDETKRIKGKRNKVIRDSFTMPSSDYAIIAALKGACLSAGVFVKKSEVLRAGLQALAKLSVPEITEIVANLEAVKTGRPAEKG